MSRRTSPFFSRPRSTLLKLLEGSSVASAATRAEVPGFRSMKRTTMLSTGAHISVERSCEGRICRPIAKIRSATSKRWATSSSFTVRLVSYHLIAII